MFLKSLVDSGFVLTIRLADDPSLVLKRYGEYLYDHLILFSPSVEEFGGSLSVEEIISFVDNGGNVLVAGNSQVREQLHGIMFVINQSINHSSSCGRVQSLKNTCQWDIC